MLTNDYKRLLSAIHKMNSEVCENLNPMRSFCRLWTHTVFTTKYREPLLLPGPEIDIHQHMHQQLKKLGCVPIVINGTADHLHVLFGADYKKSVMEIMRDLKGETSFWCNKNRILPHKLEWQDGFGAFSVGADGVRRVCDYILNQKQHHRVKGYAEETDELIARYGLAEFGLPT